MDYEEVIHLLEAEIAELKTQRMEHPGTTKKVGDLESQIYLNTTKSQQWTETLPDV